MLHLEDNFSNNKRSLTAMVISISVGYCPQQQTQRLQLTRSSASTQAHLPHSLLNLVLRAYLESSDLTVVLRHVL